VSADPRKVVSEDGTPVAVWRSGAGPPLLLIHGAAADHNRWAPVLAALQERFIVFAVDRRGRGMSGDATDYALEREYEDVVAVVESAGDGVSVLGQHGDHEHPPHRVRHLGAAGAGSPAAHAVRLRAGGPLQPL
jgi:pimeloyl-ACP methyl ester carboxylesterase